MTRFYSRANQINDMHAENRLERLLLNGVTNQRQLAAAMGVSQQAIGHRIRDIYKRWKEEAKEQEGYLRELRINQLNMVMQKALNAYELSSKIEVNTTEEHDCGECAGTGQLEEMPGEFDPCMYCSGTGKIEEDVVKVVEQPGDVAYLKLTKELISEMGKLDGIYPMTSSLRSSARAVVSATDSTGNLEIRAEVEKLYYNSDDEVILIAKGMIEEMERKAKARNSDKSILETKLVEQKPDEE